MSTCGHCFQHCEWLYVSPLTIAHCKKPASLTKTESNTDRVLKALRVGLVGCSFHGCVDSVAMVPCRKMRGTLNMDIGHNLMKRLLAKKSAKKEEKLERRTHWIVTPLVRLRLKMCGDPLVGCRLESRLHAR